MSETPDVSLPESLTSMLPEAVRTRYRVDAELGRGNMGVVYRAYDRHLARPAAIKELYSVMARGGDQARAEARFLREARLSARLSHPNVITIFDILHAEERWFLVMELLEGRTLRQILREREGVSPAQARAWIAQAARGLEAAHRAGIIHRDIKPENLMVMGGGWVKLMDFGIALSADSSRLTGAGGTMGTPAYLAPELLQGSLPDARTDLFALGVVLYELLMGHNPYSGGTVTQVLMRVAQTQALSLKQVMPGIPRDLDRILLRLTAPEPDRRYASAAELADDLERATIEAADALEEGEEQETLNGNLSGNLRPERDSRRGKGMGSWAGRWGIGGWPTGGWRTGPWRFTQRPARFSTVVRTGAAVMMASALGGFLVMRTPMRQVSDHPLGPSSASVSLATTGQGTPSMQSPERAPFPVSAASIGTAASPSPGTPSTTAPDAATTRSLPLASLPPAASVTTGSPGTIAEASSHTQEMLDRARGCSHRKGAQAEMRCLEATLPVLQPGVELPREARQLLLSLLNQDALLERGLDLASKALLKAEYESILGKLLKSPDSTRRWAAAPRLRNLGGRVDDVTLYRRDLEDSSCQVRRDAALYFADHPTPAAKADLEQAFRQAETITVKPADLFHGRLLGKKVEERRPHCDYDALKLALDGLKAR